MRLAVRVFATLSISWFFVHCDSAHAIETTAPWGSNSPSPFQNEQPSLTLNYVVRINGNDEDLGEVGLFAGSFNPRDWALAHGQILPIANNTALFSKLGNTFGGDAINTFALPDLRGRTAIGAGQGPGLPSYNLGQEVGTERITLSDVPEHTHSFGNGLTTGTAGSDSTHSNMQPSLALTPIIAIQGLFPSRSLTSEDSGDPGIARIGLSGQEPFLGEVTWIAHDDIPQGWARADGELLDISQNQALFSILGTIYGGDGRTNFALPDLRGRAVVGEGLGPGLSNRPIGSQAGDHEETLTESHLPAHMHDFLGSDAVTGSTGGGQQQSNLQPTLALSNILALEGVFPSRALEEEPADPNLPQRIGSGEPFLASVSMFAGNFNPRGWIDTHGQDLPIAQYSAVFSLLGTDYGGDGRSDFGIPDLRGRVAVGQGTGPGLTPRNLGSSFGQQMSALTEANIPSHVHQIPEPSTILLLAGIASFALLAERRSR
ncbi:MAG: tail fiber protein [Lacipirellulaceae bacterium]